MFNLYKREERKNGWIVIFLWVTQCLTFIMFPFQILTDSKLFISQKIFYKFLYTKTAAYIAVLLPIKSSSNNDPGFRHGFGAEASLPLTQGAPAVSHNTTRLYWMAFVLYKCLIRSDAVIVWFWIFFIYSLFSAGESLCLVKM